MEPTATRRIGECQEWRERTDFGHTDTQQKKHLPLGKRWSHKVKERMHSTDVAFRNEPSSKKQPMQGRHMGLEMTWRKAQEPGKALAQAQAPPEWWDHYICTHV